MRQPVNFNSEPGSRISPIFGDAPELEEPIHRPVPSRPRAAFDRAVRRNNSTTVRAILVVVVVIMLAALAYLISLSAHPSITDLLPKPGSLTAPGVVTIEAHVAAAKPIQEVALTIDGVKRVPAVITNGDRSWVVRFQSVLPRGTHQAVVDVTDENGTHQSQAWSFQASGPRIAPTIAFSDPPSDATMPQGLLWIHASVNSDADISTATLTVNGQLIPTTLTPVGPVQSAPQTDSTASRTWSVSSEHAFSAGTYDLHLVTTDAQGDTSAADWKFSVTSDPAQETARYFSSTKLYVTGQFLTYWEAHDGARLFGAPVSPLVTDSRGTTMQYFEYARLEVGKNGGVALGLLGDEAMTSTQQRVDKPTNFSGVYFQATGHTLAGRFEDFWKANGGIATFGYPISEVIVQNGTKVQYFERARFELATDAAGFTSVKLTPLGEQIWKAKESGLTP